MILLNQILPKGLGNKHKQHEHFKILETSKLNQNYWPTRILNLGGSGRVYAQALVPLYSKKPSAGFLFYIKAMWLSAERIHSLCVWESPILRHCVQDGSKLTSLAHKCLLNCIKQALEKSQAS